MFLNSIHALTTHLRHLPNVHVSNTEADAIPVYNVDNRKQEQHSQIVGASINPASATNDFEIVSGEIELLKLHFTRGHSIDLTAHPEGVMQLDVYDANDISQVIADNLKYTSILGGELSHGTSSAISEISKTDDFNYGHKFNNGIWLRTTHNTTLDIGEFRANVYWRDADALVSEGQVASLQAQIAQLEQVVADLWASVNPVE